MRSSWPCRLAPLTKFLAAGPFGMTVLYPAPVSYFFFQVFQQALTNPDSDFRHKKGWTSSIFRSAPGTPVGGGVGEI